MISDVAVLINAGATGGAEKACFELKKRWDQLGVQPWLCVLEESESDIFKECTNYKVLSKSNRSKLISLTYQIRNLYQFVRDKNVQLIQAHLLRSAYIAIIVKILLFGRLKIQIVNHSVMSRFKSEGFSGRLNHFLIKMLYRYADSIVSVSNYVKDDFISCFKIHVPHNVIYNPFDIRNIQLKAMEEPPCLLPNDYFVYVGRLNKIKGIETIIQAVALDDSNLIIIGDGPERKRLEAVTKSGNVKFLGELDNPYPIVKGAKALILASSSESFGNVVVEARVCGTTVISSKCGGPEELLHHNEDLLFEINDEKSLSEKLRKYRAASVKSCKSLDGWDNEYLSQFESNVVADKYNKLISELLERSPSGAL